MLTTIILVSLGLAAIIATSVAVGMWLDRAIDEVFRDEHENVEDARG